MDVGGSRSREYATAPAAAKAREALVNILPVKLIVPLASTLLAATALAAPPHLEKHGSTQQLMVHDRPYLILGGELGNSSASSAEYMKPHWPRLAAMHLNTVLAPVSWELIEPAEGKFDWTSLDALLRDARAHDLKLVILWFGAWKNSMSTYVPSWVKRDQARFPRVRHADGSSVEILSVFSKNTLAADARAFAETASDIFFRVQAAWTARSVAPVASLLTPEMAEVLQQDCDRLRAERKINRLENIAVRSAEVSEAWQESTQDFVTVHFLASLLDYTTDESGARLLEGSHTEPVKFEEYWTFTRPVGATVKSTQMETAKGGRVLMTPWMR